MKMFEKIFKTTKDKNPKNEWGQTPFHTACKYGHFKLTKRIMEICACISVDFKAMDCHGKTPFHYACSKEHLRVVEMLIL